MTVDKTLEERWRKDMSRKFTKKKNKTKMMPEHMKIFKLVISKI